MTAKRTLAKLRPDDIYVDLDAEDVPPEGWTTGNNFVFRNNTTNRIAGYGYRMLQDMPNSVPRHLFNVLDRTDAEWLYCTDDNKVFVADGITHHNITPTPAPNPPPRFQPWTHAIINQIPVVNWQEVQPHYWTKEVTTPLQPLPGWRKNGQIDYKTEVIRTFRNYLIGLVINDGVNTYEDRLMWSDQAPPGQVPQTWEPAVDNDAGDAVLAETTGGIIDGLAMRDSFIVYKRNSTFALDYIGGNFVFRTRKLFDSIGVIARHCVIEVNGLHYVFGNSDIYVHDGVTSRSLTDRRWRYFLYSSINQDNFGNCYAALYRTFNEIWFCYPDSSATYPNKALVYNYLEDKLSLRDLQGECPHAESGILPDEQDTGTGSWEASTDQWNTVTGRWETANYDGSLDRLVLGSTDAGGRLAIADEGGTFADGTEVQALIGKHSMDLGEPDRVKTVKSIWPRVQNMTGTIEVRLGRQYAPDDAIAWTSWRPYLFGDPPAGANAPKVDVFVTGRYISYEFRSTGGTTWRKSGFDVEFEYRGRY